MADMLGRLFFCRGLIMGLYTMFCWGVGFLGTVGGKLWVL